MNARILVPLLALALVSCAGHRAGAPSPFTEIAPTLPPSASSPPLAAGAAGGNITASSPPSPAGESAADSSFAGGLLFRAAGVPAADTTCFGHATPWAPPEQPLLARPARSYVVFGRLTWDRSAGVTARDAREELRRRLGLDAVDVAGSGVRLQKAYGRRLSLLTTTGLGLSAEEGLEADYRLWRAWYIHSETRERGESSMDLSGEILFR